MYVQSAASSGEPDSITDPVHILQTLSLADDKPVDLTNKKRKWFRVFRVKTRKQNFGSSSDLSFADLASKNSGDFAFGSKDKDFKCVNTGATVFGEQKTSKADEDETGSDDEVVHSDDIHFDPVVSLPEVKVKSGEED